VRHDAGYFRQEPGAGKPSARICEGGAKWPSYSTEIIFQTASLCRALIRKDNDAIGRWGAGELCLSVPDAFGYFIWPSTVNQRLRNWPITRLSRRRSG
jgi:hypothetical protein